MGIHRTDKMKSVSVKDVDQHKFVRALAAFFKKSGKVKQPEWTDLVKTVKRIYGGHKNNGVAPSHFCASSGSVARKVMQALEAIKLVEKDANGGRRLTSQGFRDLDRIASQIKQAKA